MSHARGDYLGFVDADDVILPERIAHSIRVLEQTPGAVAHLSRLVRLDGLGRFCAPRVFPLVRFNPSSLFVRRIPVMDRIGFFDQVRAGADNEYIARLAGAFGPSALIRDRRLLTIASASAVSLTADSVTGIATAAGIRSRTAYVETWRDLHLAMARSGDPMAWRRSDDGAALEISDLSPTCR
jgi:hypothetical protein